ncbi:molybdopterin-dependent oxidoreductase [Antribacter gilvus]|uniref:molybdopterin-dependent oxidoreductase n=1 Tax=Antribacter gilvus TaxID=2304675 RepID=UPI001F0BF8E6|nr:molybdopterin-dependent oxidoreductase [Antribacter gilvus]
MKQLPWWAVLAGVVTAGAGLAVAELVAAVMAQGSSPLFAAGAAVIDGVPGWLKDLAIAWFGTADKAVLLGTMGVVLAAGAALAGVLELRRPPLGAGLVVVVGLVAAVVAALRPGATVLWAVPSLLGAAVAAALLRAASARLRDWVGEAPSGTSGTTPDPRPGAPARPGAALDRRRFLMVTGLSAAAAVVALGASRAVSIAARTVDAVRGTLRLPVPATSAPPVPVTADLASAATSGAVDLEPAALDGLAPYVTPNAEFYRIDTALRVPQVDPAEWSLTVTGLVDAPFTLTWDELLALPLEEHHVTLACVSNEVGGNLIGNALWLGYPVRELLARARPQAGADMVLSRSVDGFTAGTPIGTLTDPDRASLLAVGMNGEPLPVDHGFPARLVVPGLFGYVSATKWVTELRVTRFAVDQGYWTPRGWSALGPVKLQSRIDVPRPGGVARDGVVAGVAWAQHIGISAVEVRVDDGPWRPAELAATVGPDTWRQWWVALDDVGAGDHVVQVRAIDPDGRVQTAHEAPPAPDGASGHHTVTITIA